MLFSYSGPILMYNEFEKKKNARPWIYVWLTVFENNRKSLIQHSTFTSRVDKSTVLPERSISIEKKMVRNAQISKFKCDIFE